MNPFPRIFTLTGFSLMMLSLASCASTHLQVESPLSPDTPSQLISSQPEEAAKSTPEKSGESSPILKETTAPTDTIPITIYRVDSECSTLIPEQVVVPVDQSLETAVAKTLEIQKAFEIPLGYRVEVDHYYQIAVIDLRVPTTSRRLLTSLSACEQFALFGSLRKTLTSNPDWQIQEVYFTNLGEDLIL